MCKVLQEVQADVYCGQEHNLDVIKPQVKSIMFDATRQHWQRSRMTLGTTPLDCKTMYKPGGTMMLTLAHASGRITSHYTDKWGRWVSQTMQGGTNRKITIVSAYQVVTDVVHPGQITVAAQQHTLLIQTKDALHSPRAAFRRDLIKYLKDCKQQGSEIILVGDFNEVIGSDPDGLVKIMNEASLINVMNAKHAAGLPTTYTRGRTCLDYVFISANLTPSVRMCGYEPFQIRHPSDHRAYFVDFNIRQLFGSDISPLSKYEPRMLQSTNVRQVTEYINYKYESLMRSNMVQRSQMLNRPGDRHKFAERMDKDILAASLAAENHITKFAAPQWSVELKSARSQVQLLRKHLSFLNTGIPLNQQTISTLEESLKPEALPADKRSGQQAFRRAKSRVQQIISHSYERRDIERNTLIEHLQISTKPSDQERLKVLRSLRKLEMIRQLFNKLKMARRTLASARTGVLRIEIPLHPNSDPKTCTEWKLIDIPSEVLCHLQARNQRHFGQAHGTPFTVSPLQEDFGYCGNTPATTRLLHGNYDHSELDTSVKLLLEHLQHTAEMATLNNFPTISKLDFQAKLKVWRESTTTSPSGLHLGHYKAMLARHQYSEVTEQDNRDMIIKRDELCRRQAVLLELHLQMINYALSRGYSFKRWQTVANTMLFKEPGNIKIHRTRVIHIYEADYNLAMGLKWNEALYKADNKQLLHPGQYGSRPNRRATDPVLLEELQLEMSRITRKTLIQTNYDATACYDRIIPSLAMIVSQKYGVHSKVTTTNAVTLRNAEYRIRTDLGMSPRGYAHSQQQPIYGTGQGSGNSPAIWCFLSSTLYDCYDTQATKALYCAPNRTNHLEIGMIGFVDDSNGQTNQFLADETETTADEVLVQMQSNSQTWSALLGASGGTLELSKCSYHVLKWVFSAQGDPVLYTDRARYAPITVSDQHTGKTQAFEYLSPYSSHKTLGHYKDPAGTQKEQQRQLQQKSDEAVAFLWKCPLTREESWAFYFSCYVPSLSYPLPNSHFTEPQLNKIQRKAMSIIIARCGFNRHMHRAIIYGPSNFGGLEFKRLYDQQCIGQIQALLHHWRAKTVTGSLLQNIVSWGNYSVGMSSCFLAEVHTPLPHLELKWFGSIRNYLQSIHSWIEVDESGIPELERVHDCYIMEVIIRSRKYTPAQIRRLNYCRLYLHAVTLSDLTTVVGDRLDPAKLRGGTSVLSTTSRWMRINQDRPSELEWRLWQHANKLWSNTTGDLIQPLGMWINQHSKRRIQCPAYQYDKNLVIKKDNNQYEVCHHTLNSDYKERNITIRYDDIPEYARPVNIILHQATTWRIIKTTRVLSPPTPSTYGTFAEFVQTLLPWETDLLQHHELYVDPYTACLELTPQFFAGSDGSEKYGNQGAFGWVVSSYLGERVAVGMGPSRGSVMDSYRAECTGILSLLRFLIRVAQYTQMHDPWRGVIGTDSKSLLDKILPSIGDNRSHIAAKPLHELTPEWDLLIEIQEGLHLLPGVSLTHVKGHQDNNKAYDSLPLLAQLNVDADKMAGTYQDTYGQPHPYVLMSPKTGVHLVHQSGTITSKYEDRIRTLSNGPALRAKVQAKYQWSELTMGMINWKAHGKAFQSHRASKVHISKLVHDCLPTHALLNKFDSGCRQCPKCKHSKEDRDHIIRCHHDSRQTWRDNWWLAINKFHVTMHTSPLLRHVFNEAIQQWFDPQCPDTLSPVLFPSDVRRLIYQQNQIGWRQIFNGRFSEEWVRLQDEYYYHNRKHVKYRRTGTQWQHKFITLIWSQWRQLWTMRNSDVHGRTIKDRCEVERATMRQQLTDIYDNRQHLEHNVQQMLHTDVNTHLQHPTWVTRTWIAMTAPLIRDSFRRIREQSRQGVRSIRSYFRPVSTG